jgi:thiol-disulfide isomerase/thioredoxin
MIKRISIVFAHYCPHCVPFSLSNAEKMAKELRVTLRTLDIEDTEQERIADQLVEAYGDWSEDYLIPQIFIEYEDGRVQHLLTGFSESVLATKAAWKALFSSRCYRELVYHQKGMSYYSLKEFVSRFLWFNGRCRIHCDKNTTFVELYSDSERVAGAYVCLDGYASRLLCFNREPNIKWFKKFLTDQVGEEMVKDHDLRVAARYGWELKSDLTPEIKSLSPSDVINVVYWTTYPKTEEERRRGVFLCLDLQTGKGCKSLFVQELTSRNRLCSKCK